MIKRLIKGLITTFVMSSLFITTVLAAPEDDIEALENQKSAAQAQASSVSQSLVDLLADFQALEDDMANQQGKIDQATEDLAAAEEKEKTQYEDMKLRIKYMYEEGNTNFIATLLSSESFADLLSQSEYVDKVYNYDRQKLKEYVETKEEVQDLKSGLEGEEAEMEDMAVEMESQQQTLQSTLNHLESQISDYDEQLTKAKEEAAAQLAAQKAAEEAAAKAEEEAARAAEEEQQQADAQEAEEQEEKSSNEEETKAASNKTESDDSKKESSSSQGSGSGSSSSNKGSSSGSSSSGSGNSSSSSSKGSSGSSGSSGSTNSSSSSSTSSSASVSNASLGQQIADKACEYIGGKYVYGGNSLTSGVDCSGFVQQIHKLFGISTPRSSSEIRYGGKAVSWEDKLPGDVICYSGHVAIYIGNNTIVHASNSAPYPSGGIKTTTPANYRTVLAVRRYW